MAAVIRAAVLLVIGGAVIWGLPHLGVWLVVLGVPILSAPLFLLLAARAAQRQELRLIRLEPGGRLLPLLAGPWLRLLVAGGLAGAVTVLALLRLAGQPQMALAALGFGAAGVVLANAALSRLLGGELRSAYRPVTLAGWSAGAGTLLALLAAWGIGSWWMPAPIAPVVATGSALVAEALRWQALALRVEGGLLAALRDSGAAWVALLWSILTQGAGFAWVCGTLAACALPSPELARAWRPAGAGPAPSGLRLAILSATAVLTLGVAWPQIVLTVEAALFARGSLTRDARGLPSGVAEQVVEEVERIGDAFFRPGTIARIDALPRPPVAEAHGELVQTFNRGFDAMVANVDPFLDRYYSLGAEYARILALATGRLEAELQASLQEALMQGAPFAGFDAAVQRLERAVAADAARARDMAGILDEARLELPARVVPRIVARRDSLDGLAAGMDLGPVLDAARSRSRVAAGGAAGVVAVLVIRRVVAGNLLRTAAAKLAQVVATRAGGGLAGMAGGAALGGAAGSVVPGIGTAIGAVVGGIAGALALTVSIDAIALAIEEAMRRDAFRAELVAIIEAQRAEMLALLAASPG
ncbi:MAG: hypothetical protein ACK4L4_04105 [Gemmobacter sp.]